MNGSANNNHYLMPGNIFVHPDEYTVTTVLGSCVSVCLWDSVRQLGGINHFMLPLWNGDGLASPRYGNIAIAKLIEKMLDIGADRGTLKAKIFGGGDVLRVTSAFMNIGARNVVLAQDILRDERIPVISADTGGKNGRKLLFNTRTGVVLVKLLKKQVDDINI
jgi:chemotaxis protein CheD